MLHFDPDKIEACTSHGTVYLRIRGIDGAANDLLTRNEFAFNGVVDSKTLSGRGRPGVEQRCGENEGGEESCHFHYGLTSRLKGFKGQFKAAGFAVLDWFFS